MPRPTSGAIFCPLATGPVMTGHCFGFQKSLLSTSAPVGGSQKSLPRTFAGFLAPQKPPRSRPTAFFATKNWAKARSMALFTGTCIAMSPKAPADWRTPRRSAFAKPSRSARERVLDCGGKAQPPRRCSPARKLFWIRKIFIRSKAVSPLPLCHRTPRRSEPRASVLDCGSPLPLFPGRQNDAKKPCTNYSLITHHSSLTFHPQPSTRN